MPLCHIELFAKTEALKSLFVWSFYPCQAYLMPLTSTSLCTLYLGSTYKYQWSQLQDNILEVMLQWLLQMLTEARYVTWQ